MELAGPRGKKKYFLKKLRGSLFPYIFYKMRDPDLPVSFQDPNFRRNNQFLSRRSGIIGLCI